jgi:cell division septation protein DedD
MQSRYAVLNGQHPLIRRKDQGDRGVFYAAQVGPFATKDEANQVCDSLKSAGGTCFVQKN